jgi:pyridoxamine 5'-phosphate oxidase
MKKENLSIHDLRNEYSRDTLDEKSINRDPFIQFGSWFIDALKLGEMEANAMVLSTVGADQAPSSRVVLLKDYSEKGFVFYTNFESQKGKDIDGNPNVALLFFWSQLEKQVRIEGNVEKVDEKTATQYFQSRPRGSQIGAWVSKQSAVLKDRSALDDAEKAIEFKFKDYEVLPKPAYWGGYLVIPNSFEFWQGRPNRLHDRFKYSLQPSSDWIIKRLSP